MPIAILIASTEMWFIQEVQLYDISEFSYYYFIIR